MSKIRTVLSDDEYALIVESESDRIVGMSEERLLKVHKRIRQALKEADADYRRIGADKVVATGDRGLATTFLRNVQRLEVFEEALSRVSHRLGVVAHERAKHLKAQRLAVAELHGPAPHLASDAAVAASSKSKSEGKFKGEPKDKSTGERRGGKSKKREQAD